MARSMKQWGEAFRAVLIHTSSVSGETLVKYVGPYATPAPAKAQVTSHLKASYYKDPEGWVEKSETVWKRFDG